MPKTTTRPMVRIHNTETNEVIDREMNDDEFAKYEVDKAERAAKQAEAEAKAIRDAELDRQHEIASNTVETIWTGAQSASSARPTGGASWPSSTRRMRGCRP